MLVLRLTFGLAFAYTVLVLLAWLFQERLAFAARPASVPDPRRVGVERGERVALVSTDGTRLAGWSLAPKAVVAGQPSPGMLWFYGNGETVAAIWPVVRDFQPPGTAVLVVDYPGYGGSEGRTTEAGLYAAADAAYAALVARPGIDPRRIYVYGRSLGSAVATHTAARHPAAGLVLESPFTNAAAMARHLYKLLPPFSVTLRLDNLANVRRIHCPTLVFHADADRLVPTAMGLAVAAAAAGGAQGGLIHGAGHKQACGVGGGEDRDKL